MGRFVSTMSGLGALVKPKLTPKPALRPSVSQPKAPPLPVSTRPAISKPKAPTPDFIANNYGHGTGPGSIVYKGAPPSLAPPNPTPPPAMPPPMLVQPPVTSQGSGVPSMVTVVPPMPLPGGGGVFAVAPAPSAHAAVANPKPIPVSTPLVGSTKPPALPPTPPALWAPQQPPSGTKPPMPGSSPPVVVNGGGLMPVPNLPSSTQPGPGAPSTPSTVPDITGDLTKAKDMLDTASKKTGVSPAVLVVSGLIALKLLFR